jgi:Tfp pilus assembly protein PilF
MSKTRKEQLEALLADDPNDLFLQYGVAMEYLSLGDPATAVQHFRALLAVTPEYVPAYMQGGQALARLGRSDEAKTLFRAGIAAAQKKGDTHAAQEMEGMLDGLD